MFRILLQSILILAKRTSEEMKENDKTLRQSLEAINMADRCVWVCVYVCVCLCVSVYVCVCECVCVYV